MQPITRLTLIVESILGLLAILIAGLFGFFDTNQESFRDSGITWVEVASASMFFCVPLLMVLWILEKLDFWPLGQLREILDTRIGPMFAKCQWWELLLVAIAAGVGEELLFRWCLQGGMQTTSSLGAFNAILISSILFGLCHSLSTQYFWFSFGISVYLGVAMNMSGTVIAPAAAHFLYDFFALLIIRKRFMDLPIEVREQFDQLLEDEETSASFSDPKW